MTSRAPDISLCVPTYRRHGPPNLRTLAEQLPAALDGASAEFLVALNGISAERAGLPPQATAIAFAVNRGVPAAWNALGRAATGRVLVFCNDDVGLGPASLRILRDALDSDPGIGVAGPVGTVWDIGRAEHIAYLPPADAPAGTPRDCDVVSGFLFATPRADFTAIGGFDEAYTPCGYEEVDYCAAVRRRLGKRAVEVAGVPHEHEFGVSARRTWQRVRYDGRSESIGRISERNRRHFLTKWGDAVEAR